MPFRWSPSPVGSVVALAKATRKSLAEGWEDRRLDFVDLQKRKIPQSLPKNFLTSGVLFERWFFGWVIRDPKAAEVLGICV